MAKLEKVTPDYYYPHITIPPIVPTLYTIKEGMHPQYGAYKIVVLSKLPEFHAAEYLPATTYEPLQFTSPLKLVKKNNDMNNDTDSDSGNDGDIESDHSEYSDTDMSSDDDMNHEDIGFLLTPARLPGIDISGIEVKEGYELFINVRVCPEYHNSVYPNIPNNNHQTSHISGDEEMLLSGIVPQADE